MGRSGWDELTPGAGLNDRESPDSYGDIEIAKVVRVTAAGADVVLPAAPEHTFDDCPWGLASYDTPAAAYAAGHHPRVGDAALVVLAGEDHEPWVVSWWRT